VMITEEPDDHETPSSPPGPQCIMATYWEEVDGAWERAVGAGAEVIYPLADHFYGERGGRLRDPLGHQWMLSQCTEQLSHEEMNRRAAGSFGQS
jgi:PhnB protein